MRVPYLAWCLEKFISRGHRLLVLTGLLFLLFFATKAQAASTPIDSLTQLLDGANDSVQTRVYLKLFAATFHSDPQAAKAYGIKAHERAVLWGDSFLIAGTLMNRASLNKELGQHALARAQFRESFDIFTQQKDSLRMAMCLGNLAGAYTLVSAWDSALIHHEVAMLISQEIGDSVGVAIYAAGLASNFGSLGQLDSAWHYYGVALEHFLRMELNSERAVVLNNLGELFSDHREFDKGWECYREAEEIYQQLNEPVALARLHRNMGRSLLDQSQPDSARVFYASSLSLLQELEVRPGQDESLRGMGAAHQQKGEWPRAIELHKQALKLGKAGPNPSCRGGTHADMGQIYLEMKRPDQALFHLEAALILARDHGLSRLESRSCAYLAEYHRSYGSAEEAQAFQSRANRLADSLKQTIDLAAMEKLRGDYRTQQLESLKQKMQAAQQTSQEVAAKNASQQTWLLLLIGVVILAVFLGVWLRFRIRSRITRLESRNAADERANQLAVEKQVREKVSRDLHDGLGQILSSLRLRIHGIGRKSDAAQGHPPEALNQLDQMVEKALEEVRTISRQMMPRLLSQRGLSGALPELMNGIDPALIKTDLHISPSAGRLPENVEFQLYRIAQELVSNTIKHAKASTLYVQLTQSADQVLLVVEDDGCGFDPGAARSKGSGLRNIRDRVQSLGGKISMESVQPSGQITKIRIPIAP